MPWAVFGLLVANLALSGYLLATRTPAEVRMDVRTLEVNAHQVSVVRPAAQKPASLASSAEPEAKPAVAACLEWGTFGPAEVERVQAELAGAARTIVRELGLAPAWWVHVAPLPSRDEAERRAREIEAAGVKDVRVVTDGERWRNAISLGIFKTEEGANAHLARMREARVPNVAVAQRSDLLRLASLLVVEPSPNLAARIAQLRNAYPGTELRAVACPAGAA